MYVKSNLVDEHIAIVTMDRSKAKNALNAQMIQELLEQFECLSVNPQVRSIVLHGENHTFAAGADIHEMIGISASEAYTVSQNVNRLQNLIARIPQPVIAAIEGYCLGGGLELALACDIRIADTNAQLGLPEVKLGILPGGGGTQRLLELTGSAVASHLILTGSIIPASRAYELHIVSEVTDSCLEHATQIARLISSNSKNAVASIKRLLNGQLNQSLQSRLHLESHEFSLLFDHTDSVEGLSAFIEKRKPKFPSNLNIERGD
ncbi:enoyl-CoA hydratase-related protein [Neobacillus pocheonensis]|uniref:Enoyl-CoA hydratase-related protein n=1 Tax=Neobacillus pocheonensis TaxID=363869 RepID=A0ABT0WFD0_9BACI|nr:enoyl-CoA hydratase-related protein [Neobacillus pocheonensis]